MAAPNVPQDIIDRIRKLERQVSELSGRANIRPALNTIVNGSVTIKGDGVLEIQDGDGHTSLVAGRAEPDYLSGGAQTATIINRVNGNKAFAVWSETGSSTQAVRVFDGNGNPVFSDDPILGGLAQPWIPLPLPQNPTVSSWPKTTNSAYTTIASSTARLQHPAIIFRADIGWDTGATGNLQLKVGGTVVATGSSNLDMNGNVLVPDWSWDGVPGETLIELQARRTAGASTLNIYGKINYLYGAQA